MLFQAWHRTTTNRAQRSQAFPVRRSGLQHPDAASLSSGPRLLGLGSVQRKPGARPWAGTCPSACRWMGGRQVRGAPGTHLPAHVDSAFGRSHGSKHDAGKGITRVCETRRLCLGGSLLESSELTQSPSEWLKGGRGRVEEPREPQALQVPPPATLGAEFSASCSVILGAGPALVPAQHPSRRWGLSAGCAHCGWGQETRM